MHGLAAGHQGRSAGAGSCLPATRYTVKWSCTLARQTAAAAPVGAGASRRRTGRKSQATGHGELAAPRQASGAPATGYRIRNRRIDEVVQALALQTMNSSSEVVDCPLF